MNNKEESGTKLYIEPGFLKAERSLLKLILENNEYLDIIEEKLDENDLVLPEHKLIFTIIKRAKGENKDNVVSFIESQLNNTESIKEFIKIKDINLFYVEDIKGLIEDYINEITNYKLKQRIEELKKQQKILENQGKIEESISLAIELAKISKELKRRKLN